MREVGRRRLGQVFHPRALQHGPHQAHLLEYGGHVLGGGLDRLLAQLGQAPQQVGGVAPVLRPPGGEGHQHAGEQHLLLLDQRALLRREGGGGVVQARVLASLTGWGSYFSAMAGPVNRKGTSA